jgi:ATP-binding cassette subfamily B protein
VLDTAPTIVGGTKTSTDPTQTGAVEFRNVSFKYPSSALQSLHSVSFTAKQGETIAIIGATGSGKSTLVNLIPRLHDATSGEVLVNGINVRDYDMETLQDLIGYVPQKALLLKGTVASNVALNGNPDDTLIKQAIHTAQAADFVNEMENRYNAEISQSGTNLSGGQKQRLAIARAVYKQPQILIFDDSFSALDYKTDQNLRRALKLNTQNTTNIIVAQRIGTIIEADQIIVLDHGQIVGQGTHAELMQSCPIYREIADFSLPTKGVTI